MRGLEMGKFKHKLLLHFDHEFVRGDYMRKIRLKCCKNGEKMSDSGGPYYFYDGYYPETNGYYECEMVEDIVG
jgi:hypothetical protein